MPGRADALLDRMIAWLESTGAARTAHSGRHLLDHLLGTYDILAASGQSDAVCRGGLFHSVYGTNAFSSVTVQPSQRAQVRHLIGERAEALAWTFGHIDRPKVLIEAAASNFEVLPQMLQGLPVSAKDLALIECANLLEQGALWRHATLGELAKRYGMVTDDGFAPTKG